MRTSGSEQKSSSHNRRAERDIKQCAAGWTRCGCYDNEQAAAWPLVVVWGTTTARRTQLGDLIVCSGAKACGQLGLGNTAKLDHLEEIGLRTSGGTITLTVV